MFRVVTAKEYSMERQPHTTEVKKKPPPPDVNQKAIADEPKKKPVRDAGPEAMNSSMADANAPDLCIRATN